MIDLLQSISTETISDVPNGVQILHSLVTTLSQSVQKLDTTKLLQAIPIAIQKIRFFQAPTRSTLVNSANQTIALYDNPKFGKRRIKYAESEEEFAFLMQPIAFVPPTQREAIEFLQGFDDRT